MSKMIKLIVGILIIMVLILTIQTIRLNDRISNEVIKLKQDRIRTNIIKATVKRLHDNELMPIDSIENN